MKKSMLLILCLSILAAILGGCGCQHEWTAANCENPKTCDLCGEVSGNARGHVWIDATCTKAKYCSTCSKVEGDPLNHSWVDATCQLPKYCSVCNTIAGVVIDHCWEDATTEAPKTCTLCQKTDGERIITDARFTTAACREMFGIWTGRHTFDGETILGLTIEGEDLDFTVFVTANFLNDGTLELKIEYDETSFKHAFQLYTTELTFQTYLDKGYTRDEIDQLLIDTYGMNVSEYVAEQANALDMDSLAQNLSAVYYLEDGAIYCANSWDDDMDSEIFQLQDGILSYTDSGEAIKLTKQEESE